MTAPYDLAGYFSEHARQIVAGARRYRMIRTSVTAFKTDWDAGAIADLHAALGLPAKRGSPKAKSGASDVRARKGQHSPVAARTAS